MRVARRSSIAVLVVTALLAGHSPITHAASRQTTSPAQATPAHARPFLGDWTINAESPMGPATLHLSVMDEGGVVRARMKGGQQGESSISDVRAQAQSLVLRYTFDYQGQPIPTVVVLTPQADSTLGADFSMMDGQFEMKGVGRRPGQAAAAQPATGAAPSAGPRAAAPAAQPPAGRRAQPQTPRVVDLMQMMAALPAEAPATPKQPRKVLVLAR